jgi:hypothetical protein
MDYMEGDPDPREFLKRIVWTIFLALLWLVLTLGIGTYNQLLVPEKELTTGNIIFYAWMVISLIALIWANIRIWKKKFPHG